MWTKDKADSNLWSLVIDSNLFGIAIVGAMLTVLAWWITPPASDDDSGPSGGNSAAVLVAFPAAAVQTPLGAASAVAEGTALVNRAKADDALGRALLAGKSPALPPGEPITKVEWANAKKHLGAVERGTSEYAKAQALLKTMAAHDKKAAEFTAALESKVKLDGRKKFAANLEQAFLDKRMNADVSAVGPQYTVLRIRYVLASKVTANDLDKSGIVEKAQAAGFKAVQFTDGHDETWTWKLD